MDTQINDVIPVNENQVWLDHGEAPPPPLPQVSPKETDKEE